MHLLTALVLAGLLTLSVSSPGFIQAKALVQSEVLTNASVIELVKLGLADDLIIQKIRQSAGSYDTSVEGLKQLKAARVSDTVIKEMLAKGSAANQSAVINQSSSSKAQRNEFGGSSEANVALVPETDEEKRKPPQITIRGDLQTIRSILQKQMLSEDGATLVKENASQIVFKRVPKGMTAFLGQVYYRGNKPYNLLTFTFTILNGEVLLVADTDIALTDGRGVEHIVATANHNQKYRQQLRQELAALKARVESAPPAPQVPAGPHTNAVTNREPANLNPGNTTSPRVAASGSRLMDDIVEFEVPLGRTVKGFTYTSRQLSYRGRAFRFAAPLDPQYTPKFRISLNENRQLAAVIAVNSEGESPAYVIDLNTYLVIDPGQGADQKAYWSPSGRYVIFHCAYEGERFISVNLTTRKSLSGGDLSTTEKMWDVYGDPEWVEGRDTLLLKVQERCNPYGNTRCTGARTHEVTAVRELLLDAATLKFTFRRSGQ